MHLFFDTVWKLHIGEIPEKPIWVNCDILNPMCRYHPRDCDCRDVETRYNEAIAAIKQNALTVGNPEVIDRLYHGCPIADNQGFVKWYGGHETTCKWNGNKDACGNETCWDLQECQKSPTVAILTLPEEKTKNLTMKTEPIAIFNPKQISPESYTKAVKAALLEVGFEVERAKTLFPSMFINQHEAIAVIREEYLELEQECFKNQRNYDLEAQRKEAKQLAAMAIRLMIELT